MWNKTEITVADQTSVIAKKSQGYYQWNKIDDLYQDFSSEMLHKYVM